MKSEQEIQDEFDKYHHVMFKHRYHFDDFIYGYYNALLWVLSGIKDNGYEVKND